MVLTFTESEYVAMADTAKEAIYQCRLIDDLQLIDLPRVIHLVSHSAIKLKQIPSCTDTKPNKLKVIHRKNIADALTKLCKNTFKWCVREF